jgi:hypothetical protein
MVHCDSRSHVTHPPNALYRECCCVALATGSKRGRPRRTYHRVHWNGKVPRSSAARGRRLASWRLVGGCHGHVRYGQTRAGRYMFRRALRRAQCLLEWACEDVMVVPRVGRVGRGAARRARRSSCASDVDVAWRQIGLLAARQWLPPQCHGSLPSSGRYGIEGKEGALRMRPSLQLGSPDK